MIAALEHPVQRFSRKGNRGRMETLKEDDLSIIGQEPCLNLLLRVYIAFLRLGREFWSALLGFGPAFGTVLFFCGFISVAFSEGVDWMLLAGLPLVFVITVPASLRLIGPPAVLPLIAGVLVGCLAAGGLYFGLRGERVAMSWSAERDRPDSLRGKGVWESGDAVVRVRSDGAIAYGLADGSVRWTHTLPGARVVCAMSAGTGSGVGLIAHADEDDPCESVTALDLATGEVLWRSKAFFYEGSTLEELSGVLAVEDGTAVLPVKKGLRGVDARTRRVRWTLPAPRGCAFDAGHNGMALTKGRLAVTYRCAKDRGRIRIVEAATGEEAWSAPLPTVGAVAEAEVLSADPAVLRVQERGERGGDRILIYRGEDRRPAEIPVSGPEGTIDLDPLGRRFPLIPDPNVQVVGTTVYAKVVDEEGPDEDRLVAYGPDGAPRWSVSMGDYLRAFSAGPDGVTALYYEYQRGGNNGLLFTLDPGTGERRSRKVFPYNRDRSGLWMSARSGTVVLAAAEGPSPVAAYR